MTGPLAPLFAEARRSFENLRAAGRTSDILKVWCDDGLDALSSIERHVQDMERALERIHENARSWHGSEGMGRGEVSGPLDVLRDARRQMIASLIAVKGHLDTPYPDDPRWTPWTRFVEPQMHRLDESVTAALAAVEQLVSDMEKADKLASKVHDVMWEMNFKKTSAGRFEQEQWERQRKRASDLIWKLHDRIRPALARFQAAPADTKEDA